MRLPRGYKIETTQADDERGLCDTTWHAVDPDGKALNYPNSDMRPGDAEACEHAAWHDAAARWCRLAVAAGLTQEKRRGAEYARLTLGSALINIFLTGQVGFGGPEADRRALADKLREAGLLRGHDKAVQGGGWDLPKGTTIDDDGGWLDYDVHHREESPSGKPFVMLSSSPGLRLRRVDGFGKPFVEVDYGGVRFIASANSLMDVWTRKPEEER